MTEKEVRKFAKQNYLHGKTKQETFEELKKISYRTTAVLEKIIQTIPSLKEVKKIAKQNIQNGKTKQETFKELKKTCYRSTADLEKILQAIPSLREKPEEIPIKKINKRFKKFFFIGLGLLLIAHIFYLFDIEILFAVFVIIVALGLFVWFLSDYQMLQSNKHYVYCLLIAIAFCGYYMIFAQKLNFDNIDRGTCASLEPVMLLIIQKPARLIYKYLLNREPIVDNPSPTTEDAVYKLILVFASGILLLVVLFQL